MFFLTFALVLKTTKVFIILQKQANDHLLIPEDNRKPIQFHLIIIQNTDKECIYILGDYLILGISFLRFPIKVLIISENSERC